MTDNADLAPCSLRLAGACERDIDLLLLEEFLSSTEFVTWFSQQIGIDDGEIVRVVDAHRSVTHTTGESDLEVNMETLGGPVTWLIENKIGAGLQPDQAARYHLRGTDYIQKGRCVRFLAVIVAPDAYFGSVELKKGFHHRVSYEAMMAWFDDATFLGPRRRYKVALLRSAINKATLGYQPDADAGVTAFFRDYWEIAVSTFPELGMLPPKTRPGGSGRVYFKTPALTAQRLDIAHKTGRGIVDLHLRGRGIRMAVVEAKLRPLLDADMDIALAAKSAAIRIRVPMLDRTSSAVGQQEAIIEGLKAAKRLQEWVMRNTDNVSAID